MAETQARPLRVVPSGKIYRQIFDAEVQLVNTLEKTKQNVKPVELKTALIPLVHEGRTSMGESLLTNRQIEWIESMPNDYKTENPVLYKKAKEEQIAAATEPVSVVAAREVRGLADYVEAEKTGSDIIERIAESRRLRHEAAVEDLHQDMTVIANDLEPKIADAGSELINKLQENDKEIDKMLARIAQDDDLRDYSLHELNELWNLIGSQSVSRRQWIVELDDTLDGFETQRLQRIQDVLKSYAKNMEKIAFLMPPDVQRLISKEAQVINQTILNNRRAYADLNTRLMKTDVERDKNHHRVWETRVADWKQLNTDVAVDKFTLFMQSEDVKNPCRIGFLLDELKAEQKIFNSKRLDLLQALREMKPPGSTKTAVYEWNKQLATANQQLEQLHIKYLGKLHKEYERVCQDCLDQVDKYREELLEAGVCTEEKVQEVIEEHCLPQVGNQQRIFENTLETIDKSLEQLADKHSEQLRSLFKFSQGAAHLWDVHEIGLAKKERDLQERLEDCRHEHDNQNQDMEANLDIIMDRLRQESSEETLKDRLQKALLMLDKIKTSYEQFHKDQMRIVKDYPDMVKEELRGYDVAVCTFFEVDRLHPTERQQLIEQELNEEAKSRGKKHLKKKTHRSATPAGELTAPPDSRVSSSRSVTSYPGDSAISQSPVPMAVKEVLSTNAGTTFYVLTVAGEHGISEEDSGKDQDGGGATFLTESDAAEREAVAAYTENVLIPEELFKELRKIMRLEFLNHLEMWSVEAVERANSVVAAKNEELNSELDLRLHLHGPRSKRAELDIHHVRAAELVLHQERVSRHSKGINGALNDVKSRFAEMQHEHNRLAEKFRDEIDALEEVFVNASKSATLVALSHQVSTKVETHMDVIRVSLRQFRQYLDDTLQMLRESNARFIKSFKLFSDGGNFSPEEIDSYKKKLEKLAIKIDSAEGFVMADLEGMEARRLEQALDIANKFEDRFKHHLFDLTFIEKLTRWLTNTQVKIKSEVAESNAQAQALMHHLNVLERRVDACEKPNLDKEQITPTQLLDSLKLVFQAFDDRSKYINCLRHPTFLIDSPAKKSGLPSQSAKVAFTGEEKPPTQQTGQGSTALTTTVTLTTLKAAKPQIEDSAVSLIKNILTSQKMKVKLSGEGDTLADAPHTPGVIRPPGTQSTIQTEEAKARGLGRGGLQVKSLADKDRMKPARKGMGQGVESGNPRRSASGVQRNKHSHLKFDPKYYVFGDRPERETHFLAQIRRILQDALEGLLMTADLYYRQKGLRPPTRPQAIHETFELCADVVVAKLQSYFIQAEEYHNQCLQEFREQLERLEIYNGRVPPLVIREILDKHLKISETSLYKVSEGFKKNMGRWDKERSEHKILLRPTLGHPHNRNQLESLCENEDTRRKDYINGVEANTQNLKDSAKSLGSDFVQELASTSERLLLMFDSLLTVDEVEVGRVDPKRLKTSALIRRKKAGLPLEDNEYVPLIKRGSRQWAGIPTDQLNEEKQRPVKPQLTAAVTTGKTTLAHQALVDARDDVFKDYLTAFDKNLADIDCQQEEQLTAEKRWSESWQRSVKKVKDLY
ncbi:coiled-coil domain-containing protein 180-like isoform X2 [Patiria miniata]|uniref:Coiled-coil domain-containing protein 180-like n=1 Tax=Patiria miniata TaxID=46514 RepID=A0A913Z3C2_PATMI|nr:coiled-coil domain-containing protein 180-like isoform X2 [Patiria miniata]